MKKRGKRSAFQLSITTIVILVIAMVMLILGLTLVRRIMCGAMDIASETLSGAKKQISSLFSEQAGDIQCQGRDRILTIVPGRPNAFGCLITPTTEGGKYILKVKSAEPNEIMNWFTRKTDTVTVDYGESQPAVLIVEPPKNSRRRTYNVVLKITKPQGEGGGTEEVTVTLEVRSLGWLRETAC